MDAGAFTDVCKKYKALDPERDPEHEWCAMLDAARRLLHAHDHIGARSAIRKVMRYSDTIWGLEDVHLIKPLRLMAESLSREHDPLDSRNAAELGCLQQALTIARRRLPPDHMEVGRLAGEVGNHLVIAGRLDEGCALMLECVKIADENGNEYYSRFLEMVGQIRIEQGRPAEALPLIERAVRDHERRDATSFGHALACFHMSRCLSALDRTKKALDNLELALRLVDADRVDGKRRHAPLMNEIMGEIDRVKSETH